VQVRDRVRFGVGVSASVTVYSAVYFTVYMVSFT